MKVNNSNSSAIGSAEAARLQESRSGRSAGTQQTSSSGDDVHLSELVRSLRSLASDSPERQAHIEQLARAHAAGSYSVDADAVAARIVDDAISL